MFENKAREECEQVWNDAMMHFQNARNALEGSQRAIKILFAARKQWYNEGLAAGEEARRELLEICCEFRPMFYGMLCERWIGIGYWPTYGATGRIIYEKLCAILQKHGKMDNSHAQALQPL